MRNRILAGLGVAALAAFLIPVIAHRTGLRGAHALNLTLGAAGFLGVFLIRDPQWLWLPMIGVGALVVVSVWQYLTFRYRIDDDRRFLPRQFAIEYAIQFETILPMLARLGLPFPLGLSRVGSGGYRSSSKTMLSTGGRTTRPSRVLQL